MSMLIERFEKSVSNLPFTSAEAVRKDIPKSLFHIKWYKFIIKFFISIIFIAISIYFYIWLSLPLGLIVIPVLGIMYAHLVELQHECLHEHAFYSRRMNRLFGFLSGVFMFSSYWHYKYDHLRHHAYLGTEDNYEHFDYKHRNINGWFKLIIASMNLARYRLLVKHLYVSFFGGSIDGVENERVEKMIKFEYRLMLIIFIGVAALCIWYGRLDVFVFCWVISTVFVAEPVHFLIETPEYYGLNTQTNPDVLENTWTIYTNSKLLFWIANGNNLHTAHHFHPRGTHAKYQRVTINYTAVL